MAVLEGKTAIVTGASSGIGAAIAQMLVREGARVAGGARRVDRMPEGVGSLELDVADPESSERFVAAALEQLGGGLDILVNNAGLALGRDPFWDSNEEDEETVLETNINGLLRMTRLCLQHLRDGGHIVNMGSVAGREPTRTRPSTSPRSTPSAASPTRSGRTCSAAPSTSPRWIPASSRPDFSEVRFRGDVEMAEKVYANVEPLTTEDIAECVLFALTRPPHVNVDEIVVKALAQSTASRILRNA